MENFCRVVHYILGAGAQVVLMLTSRFLDGREWWDSLEPDVKATAWGVTTLVLVILAWYVGRLLSCADLPPFADALYIGLAYLFGFYFNKGLHQLRKS